MRQPLVRDVVSWEVDRTPTLTRVGQVLETVLDGVLSAAGTMPMSGVPRRPRVPEGSEELLDLPTLVVRGSATWLPPRKFGDQAVWLTTAGASINASGLPGREVRLPLARMRVMAAHPRRRSRSPHATARWLLQVDDQGQAVTFDGPWLALCWLGHLGEWPEPARR